MRRRTIAALVATGMIMATGVAAPVTADPPPPPADSDVNNNPDFLQVYVNNVENLPTEGFEGCPGDWKDLIYYMKDREYSPDLFLVQQVRDQEQLDTLTDFMTERLDGVYANVIADPEPETMTPNCGGDNDPRTIVGKEQQTNAIIYRVGRFDAPDATWTWRARADANGDGFCETSSQDRAESVAAALWDKQASRRVNVASIHWPSAASHGRECANINISEAVGQVNRTVAGSSLRVFGGDFNIGWGQAGQQWYQWINGDLGGIYNYRDPIFEHCREPGTDVDCLSDNWTHDYETAPRNRIDFLFAQAGQQPLAARLPATGAEATVTYDAADEADEKFTDADNGDLHYSEHRAVIARIHY